jgi:hypothetical protein
MTGPDPATPDTPDVPALEAAAPDAAAPDVAPPVANGGNGQGYGAHSITVLEGLEAVRK